MRRVSIPSHLPWVLISVLVPETPLTPVTSDGLLLFRAVSSGCTFCVAPESMRALRLLVFCDGRFRRFCWACMCISIALMRRLCLRRLRFDLEFLVLEFLYLQYSAESLSIIAKNLSLLSLRVSRCLVKRRSCALVARLTLELMPVRSCGPRSISRVILS